MLSYRHLARILMLCLIGFLAVSTVSELLAASGATSPLMATAIAIDEDVEQEQSDDDQSTIAVLEGDGHESNRIKERVDPGFWPNVLTLLMLVVLQAVLGFDNLLYISLESKNAPVEKRQSVRAWGIGLAIFLRIALLFALYYSREFFEQFSVFEADTKYFGANVNLHSLIVLVGGVFIMYTGVKEIWHMTRMDEAGHGHGKGKQKSLGMVIFWILLMNVVFSFDSILSAMALTDVLWVMTLAIIISGVMMIYLSEHVSTFLEKNKMYEVLGLFVLLIVGIMLVSEGGHLAHLKFFGEYVQPMTKTTFYFVLAVLVLIDIVQGRYQKKLLAKRTAAAADHA
ncbi:tellurium resistance protein TerC [Mariniblastus sp.]|nr:tellurium resistance protein TerC [Mariniblastus sp.]